MGLTAVLVDRARLVEKAATAAKVNGRTTFTTVTLPWFRARLQMPTAPKSAGPGGAATRDEVRPLLIFGIKDSEGNAIVLTTEKLVEVDSKQLGRAFFRPDADPEPYRKKRRVIGFEVPLRRVEEHEYEEVAP